MATINRSKGFTMAASPNKIGTANRGEMTKGPTRVPEFQTTLPAECWETEGALYGALVDKVSPDGLLILSIRDMLVGTQLNVRILYAHEYELEGITVGTSIVSKDLHIAEGWKGYKYQLQFVQISEQDRLNLKDLLKSPLKPEHISGGEDRIANDSSLSEALPPPSPSLDLTALPSVQCKFYENGKCLKTRAFCDLCQKADETILAQRTSGAQKSRSHFFMPITSGLAKLAGNLRFTNRDH